MASYLVTGGCGFIGSHLADALIASGHRVRILDDLSTGRRENAPAAAEIIVGDVADGATVRRAMAGMNGCFHLAAVASVERSRLEWRETNRVNLGGTIEVFDAARGAKTGAPMPVVYASSAAVYGDNTDVPLAEGAVTRPLSAYGADKLGCELHARVADVVHGVPSTGFRFFNVYGPRQDPASPYSGVISIFAQRIKRGDEITIFGDGEQSRDFVYVADVVAVLQATMSKGPKGAAVFNLCTGRETTVMTLAQTLADLSGRPLRKRFEAPRAGDIRRSLGNPAAMVAAFSRPAETGLADGLGRTLDWMK
ncbi:MAG: NAD-dependent epimerase/dehydratase family protein [Alphaproteobacteria bacterium]